MMTQRLSLAQLVPDPTQPRQTMSDLAFEMLVGSIRQHGLLLPLRVLPADAAGNHVIVSGHRRHAALLQLGKDAADCIIVTGTQSESTILAEQLAENLHRENLSPIEEAEAYRRYLSLNSATAVQAAKALQVLPTRISRLLPLLELPADIQAAIHQGIIAKETGYYLARFPEGEERNRLCAQALTGRLSRDQAARAAQSSRRQATETHLSRVTCKLADQRSLTATGQGLSVDRFIEMLEEALKLARKARAQGLDIGALTKAFKDKATQGGAG